MQNILYLISGLIPVFLILFYMIFLFRNKGKKHKIKISFDSLIENYANKYIEFEKLILEFYEPSEKFIRTGIKIMDKILELDKIQKKLKHSNYEKFMNNYGYKSLENRNQNIEKVIENLKGLILENKFHDADTKQILTKFKKRYINN